MTSRTSGVALRGAVPVAPPEGRELWEVADGTWCLRMPVDLPVKYTLCYLIHSQDETIIVDPGWDVEGGTQRVIEALHAIGSTLGHVIGIVCTHAHRDHVGLAHELAALPGARCWIAMHIGEIADHAGAETAAAWRIREEAWLDALGVPAQDRADTRMPDEAMHSILHTTRADRVLDHGELIQVGQRQLRVVHTPGHSAGSICLVEPDRRIVFTGDTLLPRISPNVGWAPHGAHDPMSDYLASLQVLAQLADHTALPGHEWPFTGIDTRSDYLIAHHADRDEEIISLLGEDTAWTLAQRLTWSREWDDLDGFQHRIAAAETAAHLRRLLHHGRVHHAENTYRAMLD